MDFSNRIQTIGEFIRENYQVVYKGDNVLEDFSNASSFLLTEEHGIPTYRKMNSLFINTFSKPEDIILIEGIKSLKEVQKNDQAMSVRLQTASKILGWDYDDLKNLLGDVYNPEICQLEISIEQIYTMFSSVSKENEKDILKQRYIKLRMDILELNCRRFDVLMKFNYVKDFDKRTTAMIETLKKIDCSHIKPFLLRVVCI